MSDLTPLNDRDGEIWFNGNFVEWRDAKAHILTHGLHYGSSVFEGERVYNGRVFKLAEHTQRLFRSAEILNMTIPFSHQELAHATIMLVERQKIDHGYIRPLIWRGSETIEIGGGATSIQAAIACWPLPEDFNHSRQKNGLKLTISSWRRPHPETVPWNAKASGLYMISTLAKQSAEAKGFDDSLMLDWQDMVAEVTTANIFFLIDGSLHTPIPNCFLDGITRQTVIGLAKADNIAVIERALYPDEVRAATEVFITGTISEITPVSCIDDCQYTIGPITKKLMEHYTQLMSG